MAALILAVAYPLMAYVTLEVWSAAELGVLTLVIGTLRIAVRSLGERSSGGGVDALGILLVIVGVVVVSSEEAVSARMYPVFVNLGALSYFAWTIRHPPSAVERIARLTEPELPDYAVAYIRRVTAVWCAFFVVNGTVALYTALWASLEVWTLYNGLLAYLMMGVLFAGEYLFRRRVRAAHESASG